MYNILVSVCNAAPIAVRETEIRCSERKRFMNRTKENLPGRSRLQLRIDVVLTVIFLAVIFFMGAMTLLTDFHGVYVAATDQKLLGAY